MMLALCLAFVCWSSSTAGIGPNGQQPGPTVVFNPLPTPGAVKGSYSVGITWANCGNIIGEVNVSCWTGPANNKKLFDQPTYAATKQNPILAKGSYTWNRTGQASGTIITIAEGSVLDNTANKNLIAATGPLDANSFPVAFPGCTIP